MGHLDLGEIGLQYMERGSGFRSDSRRLGFDDFVERKHSLAVLFAQPFCVSVPI